MKLYFENAYGKKRLIANPETEEEARKTIHLFCEERNFIIYYIREYSVNGIKHYDVGSHTEQFLLER